MSNIFSILCFIVSRKVKTQLKCKKKNLCSIWRRCCDWSNVLKVVCTISCWRFLTGWCRSSRPIEIDSDQTETWIEDHQHSTTEELAGILKIFKSIKLLVKTKSMSFILQIKLHELFGQPNMYNWPFLSFYIYILTPRPVILRAFAGKQDRLCIWKEADSTVFRARCPWYSLGAHRVW